MISWMFMLSYIILSSLLLLFLIKSNFSLRTTLLVEIIFLVLIVVVYYVRYARYIFETRKEKIIHNKIIPQKNEPLPSGKTLSFSDFLSYDVPRNDKKIPLLFFRTSPFTLENMPKEITYVLDQTIYHHPSSTQIYLDNEDCDFFIHHFYKQYLV